MRSPASPAALVAAVAESLPARRSSPAKTSARSSAGTRARSGATRTTRASRRSAAPKLPRAGIQLDVQKRVRGWAPGRAEIAAWASEALGRRAANAELSVRLVGRAEGRKLNAQYRGKDYATNVLSFPASPSAALPASDGARAATEPAHLGDLVICPPVLRAEALEQRKTLRAHWAHLIVHGSLHLIGYDHERDDDAGRMERREIAVLRRLGFTNPYVSA